MCATTVAKSTTATFKRRQDDADAFDFAGATPPKRTPRRIPAHNQQPLRPRERDAIIQSLRAGVTPRCGLPHIQVGRDGEIAAMREDIERIQDGGASIRFIIGEYGSGKSFFLQLTRAIALESDLVTLHADLAPDRRLCATQGQARNLYAELAHNMATRAKPEGNAMKSVVERFVAAVRKRADATGVSVAHLISAQLAHFSEHVGGYDFASVIHAYWEACERGNEERKNNAVRWLRGEFTHRADARNALGVRSIVDDDRMYDHLKLLGLFVHQAGYGGLLVCLDEMVNLYKLANGPARMANYEQVLRICNDCLQGSAAHIGFLMGGTPDFLFDPHKGLYSYEALHSRLAENTFARNAGVVDYTAPTLHLANLSPEDLLALLHNIRHVYAAGNASQRLLPDEALHAFLAHCALCIGQEYFRTPRNTIKEFVNLLAVLAQNPALHWSELLPQVCVSPDRESGMSDALGDDMSQRATDDSGLVSFQL
ncbi:MAG: DUF2791 family P-loop domain-containing protein [Myxococcales bacterium]|jgi:hypothetical protein|nr:DUF2791 family P-loop domain-containing protein [Myxococcales bacterium]